MLFLSGPRQVGKTTAAKQLATEFAHSLYLNWDNQSHREILVRGPDAIASELRLDQLRDDKPFCTLDELHKSRRELLPALC